MRENVMREHGIWIIGRARRVVQLGVAIGLAACSPGVFDKGSMSGSAADASASRVDVDATVRDEGGRGGRPGGSSRGEGGSLAGRGGEGGAGSKSAHGGADSEQAGRGGTGGMPKSGAGGAGAGGAMAAGGRAGVTGDSGAGGSAGVRSLPDAVPSDSYLWFAADHASVAANGAVLEWKNLGADERTARAAGTDSAPKLVMIDQRSWLAFDGNAELVLPGLPPISSLSFFAVVNAASAADALRCPSLLHMANRAPASVVQGARLEFGRHMAELLYQVEKIEVTKPKGSGSFPPDAPHLVSVVHASDRSVRMRVDAVQLGDPESVDLPEAIERNFNYIGHNHYYDSNMPYCQAFQGRIAEILLFARGVSDEERARIESYLGTKWGLTLGVP